MELSELLEWHEMNAKECFADSEFDQFSFHVRASRCLRKEIERFTKERELEI
jgi:hypothetical protein